MFLGTHTPRLDDKGRLILPAKFRDELAGGVVITKGQERCLYVFPMPEFQRIAGQLRDQPVTNKAARAYSRVFFASAHDEIPDKQGRVTVPAIDDTVTGRVVTDDGEPVRNAEIMGRLQEGQLNMPQGWNGFFWSRTDADGRFKIEGLLAGVKLGAQHRGGNLFSNLTLTPGEVRDLGEIKVKSIPD